MFTLTSLLFANLRFASKPITLSTACIATAIFAATLMPMRAQSQTTYNNSALIPKLLPDSQVNMEGMSPNWVKTLVMAEVRIETAAPDGTLATANKFLDHYSVMGVNGLWIDPIWERDPHGDGIGYNNLGINLVDPRITRTADTNLSTVKKFVSEAHQRNIRVFFDAEVWGTSKNSALVTRHPEYYKKNDDGSLVQFYGGYVWDWSSSGLRQWYTKAAVNFILKTGADGFRVDLAPDTSAYYFKEIRDQLYARGHKVVIIGEIKNDRKGTFDLDQRSVLAYPTLFDANIVDAIKSGNGIGTAAGAGQYRFYTSNLADHDDSEPVADESLVRFAYGTIFAPFIPMWWIGEEWNNPREVSNLLYFNKIDWSAIRGSNAAFYDNVKKLIRIRRSYPQIFEYFPSSTRDANIAKVASTVNGAPNPLQAYARYAGGKAILIVPNNGASSTASMFKVAMDYSAWGLHPGMSYKVTDLMTGAVVAYEKTGTQTPFTVTIPSGHLGVYLVKG